MKSVEQMINERAYAIYEERMRKGLPGDSDSDYYRAAKEVTAEIEKKNIREIKLPVLRKPKFPPEPPEPPVKKSVQVAVKAVPKAAVPAKKKVVKKKSAK